MIAMPMTSEDISALAVRAKTDRAAMSQLIKHLQETLIGQVKRSRIHPNEYADVVQELLILVLTCVKNFDPTKGLFDHFLSVCVSRFIKRYHRNMGAVFDKQTLITMEVADTTPESRSEEVSVVLGHLPDGHREIVQEFFGLDGDRQYSINQIAARRGLANTKVKKVLSESLSIMRGVAV